MKNKLYISPKSNDSLFSLLMVLIFCCSFTFSNPIQANSNCNASFDYEEHLDLLASQSHGIALHNYSDGDYTNIQWDFGDGTISNSTANPIVHYYAEEGEYTVTLSIWTDNEECFSKRVETITVEGPETDCAIIDCVFPGNANGDGQADLLDLLHIGMGYGTTGAPRPDASYEWYGQPAPDWAEETADGINYKHLDCNGDGIINEADLTPVLYNYSPMDIGTVNVQADAPRVYLQFNHDTIYINESSPETITLGAVLQMGESSQPVEEIYGFAARMSYDTSYVAENQGVSIHYHQNSFLGGTDVVLPYGQNMRAVEQVDLAFSRTNGTTASGHGRLAILEFVIIVDIIGGRAEAETYFNVPIDGIVAIGQDGQPIDIALDAQPAKVVFLNDLTKVIDPIDGQQVKVFPNPATTELNIDLGELTGSEVMLYDMLGRQVRSETMNGQQHQLMTGDLADGIYLLSVETNKGTVSRRVMID